MPKVLIGIGSNVGDRLRNLEDAITHLGRHLVVTGRAAVYETEPMYVLDQPSFYNSALCAQTELPPLGLLRLLKEIEGEVGRVAGSRYGPREIDLDLLAYGALAYKFEHAGLTVLQVPHPRTPERRFVLAPLADVAPGFVLPGLGVVCELLKATEDQSGDVIRLNVR